MKAKPGNPRAPTSIYTRLSHKLLRWLLLHDDLAPGGDETIGQRAAAIRTPLHRAERARRRRATHHRCCLAALAVLLLTGRRLADDALLGNLATPKTSDVVAE